MVDELSPALRSLEHANKMRLERSHLRNEVAAGRLDVADLIVNVPDCMQSAEIGDVLMWQCRWKRARMRRFLLDFGIAENRTLISVTRHRVFFKGISLRQRRAIAAQLRLRQEAKQQRRDRARC